LARLLKGAPLIGKARRVEEQDLVSCSSRLDDRIDSLDDEDEDESEVEVEVEIEVELEVDVDAATEKEGRDVPSVFIIRSISSLELRS
jgi:hypothetical protein